MFYSMCLWFFNPHINFSGNITQHLLNNNLLNGLLLIHPPLLYIGYLYLFLVLGWFFKLRIFTQYVYQNYSPILIHKTNLVGFSYLFIAAFLGS
jgi:cytochrome c biogenesis factor